MFRRVHLQGEVCTYKYGILCFAYISINSRSILVSNTLFYLLDWLCVRYQYRYQYRYWNRIHFSTYKTAYTDASKTCRTV